MGANRSFEFFAMIKELLLLLPAKSKHQEEEWEEEEEEEFFNHCKELETPVGTQW